MGNYDCSPKNCSSFCSSNGTLHQHSQLKPLNRRNITNRDTQSNSTEHHTYAIKCKFHDAIVSGNDNMVTYYVGKHPNEDLINAEINNEYPLHTAVGHKQYKIMRNLLNRFASTDVRNEDTGDTALHIAVRNEDLTAVQILCEFDADTSIQNECEETALSIASQTNSKTYSDIMYCLQPKNTPAAINSIISSIALLSPPAQEIEWGGTMNTARLLDATDDIFEDIQSDLNIRSMDLRPLEAWLSIKDETFPYSWTKIWVVVKETYLLWSERKMNIVNEVNAEEKRRWDVCYNVQNIISVDLVESKKSWKFKVMMTGKDYVFKCQNEELRDYWTENLNKTVKWYKSTGLFDVKGNSQNENAKLQKMM